MEAAPTPHLCYRSFYCFSYSSSLFNYRPSSFFILIYLGSCMSAPVHWWRAAPSCGAKSLLLRRPSVVHLGLNEIILSILPLAQLHHFGDLISGTFLLHFNNFFSLRLSVSTPASCVDQGGDGGGIFISAFTLRPCGALITTGHM